MGPIQIVQAETADLPAIAGIYAHHVLHGTGTFETEPPDLQAMTARLLDVQARQLPWLVARRDDAVIGFAYANWFRPRAAFQYCVEDSIYIHPDAVGAGVGGKLLDALIDRCTALGRRQMVAVIGDTQNHGSIGLHRSRGFAHIGTLPATGWKFDRWVDVVLMQRSLGTGAAEPAF